MAETSRTGNALKGTQIKDEIQRKMLKPCPFCCSEKRGFRYVGWSDDKIVVCEDCGYHTKKHHTEYLAMQDWNHYCGDYLHTSDYQHGGVTTAINAYTSIVESVAVFIFGAILGGYIMAGYLLFWVMVR